MGNESSCSRSPLPSCTAPCRMPGKNGVMLTVTVHGDDSPLHVDDTSEKSKPPSLESPRRQHVHARHRIFDHLKIQRRRLAARRRRTIRAHVRESHVHRTQREHDRSIGGRVRNVEVVVRVHGRVLRSFKPLALGVDCVPPGAICTIVEPSATIATYTLPLIPPLPSGPQSRRSSPPRLPTGNFVTAVSVPSVR